MIPISKEEIFGQCSITHAHQNCLDCDLIFVGALKDSLNGLSKAQIFANAKNTALALNKEIYELLIQVLNLSWDEIYTEGFVIETLAFSFWALLNYESFEESLIRVVNRGGDADTLGATTGALCGAYYGKESIPERWLSVLEERGEITEILSTFNAS